MAWPKLAELIPPTVIGAHRVVGECGVSSEHFYGLFEQCMEEADHVPPKSRLHLLKIAESFLRLADAVSLELPFPNAPTTAQVQ